MTEIALVDAFATRPFEGNQAAVILLDEPADAGWMQSLASELGYGATCFLHGRDLRWFAPAVELTFCGHGTLATAHLLWERGATDDELQFSTAWGSSPRTVAGRRSRSTCRCRKLSRPSCPSSPTRSARSPSPSAGRHSTSSPSWPGRRRPQPRARPRSDRPHRRARRHRDGRRRRRRACHRVALLRARLGIRRLRDRLGPLRAGRVVGAAPRSHVPRPPGIGAGSDDRCGTRWPAGAPARRRRHRAARRGVTARFPKIELHVHIEGTVRPERLLQIARRNDYPLPFDTVEGLADLYRFRDFAHFIETWILVTNALRRPPTTSARSSSTTRPRPPPYGAVYLEAIFSPAERVRRGAAVGRGLQRLLRRCRRGARAARRRDPPDARHRAGSGGRRRSRPCAPPPATATAACWASASAGSRPSTRRRAVRRRLPAWRATWAWQACRTPARWPARRACRARSSRCTPTASGTASAPSRTPAWCARSRAAAWCSTSARCRTSAPARSQRWPSTRCRPCSTRACSARSRPTTPPCSTPTWDATTRPRARGATRRGLFYDAGVAGALCDEATRARLQAIGDGFAWDDVTG